jgi:hypothetical protein
MTSLPHQSDKSPSELETRLSTLESVLKLDERLKSLETTLTSKGVTANVVPWWRNGKTVVVLGALITAILPLVTAVNGFLQNRRDSQRLLIEQQDKIRQTYLDRVLKSGITEGEQQRIFSLLSRLKGDPELQEWAREEFDKTTKKIEELTKEKASLEEQNKSLEDQLAAEKEKKVQLAQQHSPSNTAAVRKLGKEIIQTRQKVSNLQQRIGEPITVSDSKTATCTSPDGSTSVSITCAGNSSAICFAPAGGGARAQCVSSGQ